MPAKLSPAKGSRILTAYRRSLIVLAVAMLALDCAAIGIFDSKIKPDPFYFDGLLKDEIDNAILLGGDIFAIVLFTLLVFRPRGFTLFKNLSSRVLTGCRVFLSLGLTALVLWEPAIELKLLINIKSFIEERLSDPAQAHAVYMHYFLCERNEDFEGVEPSMAQALQQYCQVARARWFLSFFLAVLVLGELALSYWARDFKVQQERDRELQAGAGEYKTMSDAEA
ncbi:hypothetical protein BGZ70_010190 [Mortierella alpina]|uniref:Uncharacterized protein n=1 Tax=Mortierella alpina TaxID=64518 RepID=A0A9P6J1P6_MORAP|nr:hypothetical protein BGZ70_010190 [Mortierella alpina]